MQIFLLLDCTRRPPLTLRVFDERLTIASSKTEGIVVELTVVPASDVLNTTKATTFRKA